MRRWILPLSTSLVSICRVLCAHLLVCRLRWLGWLLLSLRLILSSGFKDSLVVREQFWVEIVFNSDREGDSIHMVQRRINTFTSKNELTHLLLWSISSHCAEKLLYQTVHVEELVHLLFLFKDGHDLPNLFALLHDSTKERNSIAHRLSSLVACLHYRYAVCLTTGLDLHEWIQNTVTLADLV